MPAVAGAQARGSAAGPAMSSVRRHLDRHLVIELLPAAVFFAVNLLWGFDAATAAGMAASVAAVLAGWLLERRIPLIALSTLVIVLLLGGASLALDDERFVKMRPTIGKGLFAAALAVGLAFRPSFLERVLGGQLHLRRGGWRVLTYCWIAFALATAALNELLWRRLETDDWVAADTALGPLTILGYVLITRLVAQRWWDAEAARAAEAQRKPDVTACGS